MSNVLPDGLKRKYRNYTAKPPIPAGLETSGYFQKRNNHFTYLPANIQ